MNAGSALDPLPSTIAPDALRLMSGLLVDARMLVDEGRARASDVDTAMRLGAGHPEGPFALMARHGRPPAGTEDAQAALPASGEAWSGPVGLVGSGTMAGGIAEAIARSGRPVRVLTRSPSSFAAMTARIRSSLDRSVEKGRFTALDAERWSALVSRVDVPEALAGSTVVIEAVREDLEVKRRTFADLHAALPGEVALATNTSSFRVADVAGSAPGRAVFAMHFFNPAQAMKLVELVFPDGIDPALAARAAALVSDMGKTAVQCADHRGFVVNRLLIPFLNDAVRAVEAGAAPEVIDRTMVEGLGHPMGPLALIDLIGLDVTLLALDAMAETERDARITPASLLREHAAAGRLGRKSGRGFFAYGRA